MENLNKVLAEPRRFSSEEERKIYDKFKMLAAFVGAEFFFNDRELDEVYRFYNNDGEIIKAGKISELNYDSDYNLIMEVWERIQSLAIVQKVSLQNNTCMIEIYPSTGINPVPSLNVQADNPITAMLVVFIEFVNWYNQINK